MAPQRPLPAVPRVSDPALFDYLTQLHAVTLANQSALTAPNLPSSLTVTPVAGGNVIQFTRSNGITFNLYKGNSPDRSTATQVNLGSANTYTDTVGQGGVVRYYWVEALNAQGLSSGISNPKSGTTLALGTPAATIPPVAQSYATVFDTTIGANRPVIASIDTGVAGQPLSPVGTGGE